MCISLPIIAFDGDSLSAQFRKQLEARVSFDFGQWHAIVVNLHRW